MLIGCFFRLVIRNNPSYADGTLLNPFRGCVSVFLLLFSFVWLFVVVFVWLFVCCFVLFF